MLKEIIRTWTKNEWLGLGVVILVLLILTWLPYIYLASKTPAGFVYNSSTFVNPGDNTVYFSYIRQGTAGGWLVDNMYTSEKTLPVLHPFWTALGKIGNIFSFTPPTIFHLARTILIPIFIFFTYLFISYFLINRVMRQIALSFFSMGAGWGWLFVLAKPFFWFDNAWHNVPFDFFIPDAFPFTSMVISPHFILSWLLLIIALNFGFFALKYNNYFYTFISALTSGILLLLHPFYIPSIFSILGVYWLFLSIKERTFFWSGTGKIFLIFLAALPSVGYYIYLYFFDPVTHIKTLQNFLPSPKIFITFLSFGVTFILTLFSFWRYQQSKEREAKDFDWLLIWSVVTAGLLYTPFLWQRRLAEGWFFPLSILFTYLVARVDKYFSTQTKDWSIKRWFVWVPLILVFILSNLNFLGLNFFYIQKQSYAYYYYPQEFIAVADWLEQQTDKDKIIFTNYDMWFRTAPALVTRRQYLGHLVETVDSHKKYLEMKWFFQNNNHDDKKYKFLQQTGIDYLVYYQAAPDFNIFQPQAKDYLQPVFSQNNIAIYRVVSNDYDDK